jgi:hypothetical protein
MKRLIMLAVVLLTFVLAVPAAANDPARFTITDSPYYLLSSDGNGAYADWRLPNSDPCVNAWVASDGLFFAYLYRGSDLGDDCHVNYPVRMYRLTFTADSAICGALRLGGDGQTCSLVADDKPRISFDKLFAARVKQSLGRFMFYLNGNSYQLECAGDVTGSGNTRVVSNTTHMAVLKRVSGKKPLQIGAPFVFPFELTVERVVP